MNYEERLTEQDAAALVALLAATFKVKTPALRFNAGNRRGYYYPSKKLISISRTPKAKTVVHEFAHYLDHVETGRSSGRQANDREWHSQGFYYKLRKVVRACGGEYPWQREYRQLARWAARDVGLRTGNGIKFPATAERQEP